MKTLIRTAALTAVALSCFAAQSQAREADFVYQVWACDMPTHAVVTNQYFHSIDSYHFSLADAEKREEELAEKGISSSAIPLNGPPHKKWVYENSVMVEQFDDADTAYEFAEVMMEKYDAYFWVKKVEVYPWGP